VVFDGSMFGRLGNTRPETFRNSVGNRCPHARSFFGSKFMTFMVAHRAPRRP